MTLFVCSNCGYGSASWIGKCPSCGHWKTFVEKPSFTEESKNGKSGKKSNIKMQLTPLNKINSTQKKRKKTGIFEIDRVLGGGIVPGAVILLTGEPGIGKSTLILQALQNMKALYISGEEASDQLKNRADRLQVNIDNFLFSDTLQVEGIVEGINEIKDTIDAVIIDSIQTIFSKIVDSSSGSVSQLKETVSQLIIAAKKFKIPIILIGHVTKEGEIAGPKTIEHYVDCVLQFEGEKNSHYRLLRSTKNRFGPTDEIGVFEMQDKGLIEVNDPMVFLENSEKLSAGKAIVGIMEGNRPLFFEIQTLVVPTMLAVPRRVVKGLDYNKVQLLLAVIRKYLNIPLDSYDIYVNVIGGITIRSTAVDLGCIASLLSSLKNNPLPLRSVFIGEVGLSGEVRKTYFEEKIVSEAKRLGFKSIYSTGNISHVRFLKTI
ncbi:MAG: repair protein radA protein [Candidatus Roizmanbacteria bacterium GW2011_GWA2_36_23]|uniref:DNA repair protein RadA n=1 Tax=Candidatus Roizmanbacteria bacterium GW2011_GWA2_36_23 TaxID=1618480 RepID=A0A0G0E5D5_9BACT|nr:MAG: repair protein radA protein [Candidatus Roizmanbacteria bacterium GW2011_GWA2_36_23]